MPDFGRVLVGKASQSALRPDRRADFEVFSIRIRWKSGAEAPVSCPEAILRNMGYNFEVSVWALEIGFGLPITSHGEFYRERTANK